MGLFDELLVGPLAGFPVLHRGEGVGYCFTSIPVSTRFRWGEAAQGQPRIPSAPSAPSWCLHPAWACAVPLQPSDLLVVG